MKKKNKILILVPRFTSVGGVTNYYQTIRQHFPENILYLSRGTKRWPHRQNVLTEFFRIFLDFLKYFLLLIREDIALVQTTTAFSPLSIWRDGVFLLLAKLLGIKVIVFFRGWDQNYVKKIETKNLPVFKWVYFQADALIDLAAENIQKLISWGYKKATYLETTLVDETILNGVDDQFLRSKFSVDRKKLNLLFLARVEKTKGIYEALEAFRLLKQGYPHLSMTIAGDGFELEKLPTYIANNNLSDIHITGFISGAEKSEVYRESHIYLFPSYFEGMPNSVLEAMAFGLPVICRPVGGVKDVVQHGQSGFLVESKDPQDFARAIEKLINDPGKMLTMSLYNYHYAQQKFYSKVVAGRMLNIFQSVLER